MKVGVWFLCIVLLLARPADAAPEYLRYYKAGIEAVETGDWGRVAQMMERALEQEPEEKRRLKLRRGGYLPHFYLGLASYHLGNCQRALEAWAESEGQGAIVGREEFSELLRLQEDCRDNGRPTLSDSSAAGSLKTRKTGKEKVRTGQHWVEKGADPTRKLLGAVEEASPDSELGKAARHGQAAVNVAEKATDFVDVVLSPSERLAAAIDAYFAGNPQRTLQLLQESDLSDPRARAQVHLFRAAAGFRLHLLNAQDQTHLSEARKSADLFQSAQWRKDFPEELFDPRFVTFLRGGGG